MRAAVSASLDEVDTLKKRLVAAQEAIDSLNTAVDAAKKAIDANTEERAAHERTLAIAERAIKEQQDLIVMYEGAIKTLTTLVELTMKRVDVLEHKLDKANGRTAVLGIVLTVAGILVGLRR